MGLTISFSIAIVLEIILPIGLAYWAVKRFRVGWTVILIGGIVYMAVQAIQIPVLQGVSTLFTNGSLAEPNATWRPIVDGLILGLSAGIMAELARWGTMKFIKQISQNLQSALSLGIGYGMIETIMLVGIPIVLSFIMMVTYKNADVNDPTLPEGLVTQVQELWKLPWHVPLIGAVERVASLLTHITLSVIVLQVFLCKKISYLFIAMGWHILLESIPIIMDGLSVSVWLIDGLLVIFSVVNIYILMRLGVFSLIREGIVEADNSEKEGA